MPSFTTDAASYDPGADIVCTISGSAEAPTSATLNGVAVTVQAGATSGSATITAPAKSLFAFGQTHEQTRWGVDQDLVLSFPTEADATAQVQIEPTGSDDHFYQSTGNPSGSQHETGTDVGDDVYFERISGGLTSISTGGVIVASALPLVLKRRWFDVSVGYWSAIDTVAIDLAGVDYPSSIKVKTDVAPLTDGVITRRSSGGTVRSVDLNQQNLYRLTLTHPKITTADRNTLVTFYNTNRLNVIAISPANDPYTYLCTYDSEPRRNDISSTRVDLVAQFTGRRKMVGA